VRYFVAFRAFFAASSSFSPSIVPRIEIFPYFLRLATALSYDCCRLL